MVRRLGSSGRSWGGSGSCGNHRCGNYGGSGCGHRGGTDAIDDFDAIVAFGDFKFGNAAFANEINQCFKFAKIHDVRSG